MRRFVISFLGAFVALVAIASAGVIGTMVTDKAQYVPGETVTFTLDNWSSATGCSATDLPFIDIYDDENQLFAQVTNATISGSTVTATYLADSIGVFTARTAAQQQSCAVRSVSFAVVAPQPTTTTTTVPPTTVAPTTTVAATTTTTVVGVGLPTTGAPSALWLVAVVGTIGLGGALVATTRRSR